MFVQWAYLPMQCSVSLSPVQFAWHLVKTLSFVMSVHNIGASCRSMFWILVETDIGRDATCVTVWDERYVILHPFMILLRRTASPYDLHSSSLICSDDRSRVYVDELGLPVNVYSSWRISCSPKQSMMSQSSIRDIVIGLKSSRYMVKVCRNVHRRFPALYRLLSTTLIGSLCLRTWYTNSSDQCFYLPNCIASLLVCNSLSISHVSHVALLMCLSSCCCLCDKIKSMDGLCPLGLCYTI